MDIIENNFTTKLCIENLNFILGGTQTKKYERVQLSERYLSIGEGAITRSTSKMNEERRTAKN